MKYDFSSIIDRTGKDALAVDTIPFKNAQVAEGFRPIPMWVADMNFATAPSIPQRIIERANHHLYGYYYPSEEYYKCIIKWQEAHHGVTDLTSDAIGYENGVLGCLASALQAFTAPGEAVLIHAPTYTGFTSVITDNGRKIISSDLFLDEEGIWRMDFSDMDKKLKEHDIHFCIFCSPHNPTGRVWEKEEIQSAMEVLLQNQCIVFSDEIWSDLVLPGYRHTPTQSISDAAKNAVIAAYAPSKTFNLAGLIGSYHIIYNPYLRDKLNKVSAATHYNYMNVLSMHGLIGAYSDAGEEWLEELRLVLENNINYAYDFIHEHFPGVTCARPQGTYMLYLDAGDWCRTHGCTIQDVLLAGVSVGVIWMDGTLFQKPDTIRMNLALPKTLLEEALERLAKFVFV